MPYKGLMPRLHGLYVTLQPRYTNIRQWHHDFPILVFFCRPIWRAQTPGDDGSNQRTNTPGDDVVRTHVTHGSTQALFTTFFNFLTILITIKVMTTVGDNGNRCEWKLRLAQKKPTSWITHALSVDRLVWHSCPARNIKNILTHRCLHYSSSSWKVASYSFFYSAVQTLPWT